MEKDLNGNPYDAIGNLRVTYIRREERNTTKDWAGEDVIRIQACYDGKPMPGPECSVDTALDLVATLARFIKNRGRG
jgi:hypothetical protein